VKIDSPQAAIYNSVPELSEQSAEKKNFVPKPVSFFNF
jgi:hypothetical protein